MQSIPLIGAERRGSAIRVFSRISKEPIRIHSQIYEPDVIVCIDPSLFKDYQDVVTQGLKKGGILIVNTTEDPSNIKVDESITVCTVDASGISVELGLEFGGGYVVNAPMLGAIAKLMDFLPIDDLLEHVGNKWKGDWGAKIQKSVQMAYDQLKCNK